MLVLVDALGHGALEPDDAHPRHVVLVAAVSAVALLVTAVAALVGSRRPLELLAALGLVLGSLGWGLANASAPYRVVGVVLGVLLACASFVSSAGTVRRPRRLVFFLVALVLFLVLLPSLLAVGVALGLLLELVRSRLGASGRALIRA